MDRVSYIENLNNKAYYAKSVMDRDSSLFNEKSELSRNWVKAASEGYQDYLKEKVKNPVAATIAMRDTVRKSPILNPESFVENQAKLERRPEVDQYICQLAANDLMQAKTAYVRQEIIAKDRINLNSVTPKLKGAKKLAFKLGLMFK